MYKHAVIALLFLTPLAVGAQTAEQSALLAQLAQLQALLAGAQSSTAATQCVVITQSLARGSTGAEVTSLQSFLARQKLLASENITGTFGPLTEAAVKQFQVSRGIEPTGTVGPRTRAALANCGAASSNVTTNTSSVTTSSAASQCPAIQKPTVCTNPTQVLLNGCTVGWQCTVSQLPPQTFTATPTSGPGPLVVKFAGVVTSASPGFCAGSHCAATLSFGDGKVGAVPLPSQQNAAVWYELSHTYTSGGTFSSTLHQGAAAMTTPLVGTAIPITVTGIVNTATPATFSATPTFGSAPLSVTFTAGNIASTGGYTIDFGDGTSGSLQAAGTGFVANHTYTSAGSYTAKLRAPLSPGVPCQGSACTTLSIVSISVGGGAALNASLAAEPSTGTTPLQVLFGTNAAGSTYFGGVVLDYGDGATEVVCGPGQSCGQRNMVHTYTTGGTFTARLIGIGEGGNTSLRSTTVVVTGLTTGPTKIVVDAPKATAKKGDSVELSWTITGTRPTSGTIAFDLYTSGGTRIGTILSIDKFQSGSATWKIPSSLDTSCVQEQPNGLCGVKLTPGSYSVRAAVSGVTPAPEIVNGPTFTIQEEPLRNFTVSVTPVNVEIGKQLNIKYAVGNAPQNSGLALWLVKPSGEKVVRIGTKLEADSEVTTYPWTVSTVATGTYHIAAYVYTPLSADDNTSAATQIGTVTSNSITIKDVGGGGACTVLTRNLAPGDRDEGTGGEVSKLQEFLAQDPEIYPEGLISGFYGNATRRAVERWQAAHGIASSGSPETNGYGAVGPRTRAAIAAGCTSSGVSLSASPKAGPAALRVTFRANFAQPGTYSVDFGDGSVLGPIAVRESVCSDGVDFGGCSLRYDFTHVYEANGTYIVKLTAEGSTNPIATVTVTVGGALEEDCAAITRQLQQGDTDANKGGDVSRLQQYLAKSPSIYPEGLVTGYYGPATTAAVKRYQEARGIAQTGNVGPATLAVIQCKSANPTTAIIEAAPSSGQPPLTVTFKTSIDVTGGSYRIDFGDKSSEWLTSQTTTHTYTDPGTYPIKLVKSIGNCYGLSGDPLAICEIGFSQVLGSGTVVVNGTISGNLTASPHQGNAPLTVNFTANSTNGCLVGSTFTFGDGASEPMPSGCATSHSFTHTYTTAGTYTVEFKNGAGKLLHNGTITVSAGSGGGGAGGAGGAIDGPAGPLAKCGTLSAGEWIRRGQYVQSCNGNERIGLKENGALYYAAAALGYPNNLMVIGIETNGLGSPLSHSLLWNYPNAVGLKMGANGKLQYYLTPTEVIWETSNVTSPGAYLTFYPQVTILTPSGFQIWPTPDYYPPAGGGGNQPPPSTG